MRILLTGAGGFIGARFASLAVAEGHYVLGIGRSARPARLNELRKQSKFSYQIMDVGDAAALASRARTFQPAVVVHMAALGVVRADTVPEEELLRSHFHGALAVAASAQETSAAVVWLGCGCEYAPSDVPLGEDHPTEPVSTFGLAKSLAWRAFQRLAVGRLRATALRPFAVYGPGERDDRFTRSALRAAMGRGPNQLGDPLLVRDLVFVDDVVRAVLAACETTRLQPTSEHPVINLCTGTGTSHGALVRAVAQAAHVPDFRPGFGPPAAPELEPAYLVGRPEKAERVLGWRATTPLDDGLGQVYADLKAHP